jgi:hypothetical protein
VIAVASSAYATSTIVYVVCTCDARNAGTDDLVEMTHAGGGTTPWQPLDNGGIDDNERGLCYRFAYHNQPDVDPIEVKLRIRGKDGWCFNWVEAWRLPEHSPVIGLRWFSGDWRDGIWLDNNETMRDWLHLPTECNRWGNCFGFVGEPEF